MRNTASFNLPIDGQLRDVAGHATRYVAGSRRSEPPWGQSEAFTEGEQVSAGSLHPHIRMR